MNVGAMILDGLFTGQRHGNGYKFNSIKVQDLAEDQQHPEMKRLYLAGKAKKFYRRFGLNGTDFEAFLERRDNM